jgi:hypothetical protein
LKEAGINKKLSNVVGNCAGSGLQELITAWSATLERLETDADAPLPM